MSKPALRADAVRNRERILVVARDEFAAGNANAALETIAQAAGVGIGTLYRHFPTREALVEEVYRSELDALAASAEELLRDHEAFEALRLWMDHFARFLTAKLAMREALRRTLASGSGPAPEARARMNGALDRLISAGISDGTVHPRIQAGDVTVALAGIVMATAASRDQHQLRRLIEMLVRGLKPS